MVEGHQNPAAEAIPGTPGIREVRIGSGSENFNPARRTRRGGLRPEIAIFPPLESDQEAVTRFSARGSCKSGDNYDGVGEFCIKRMEENAAKLEKDLIMKELETLDFLEALGSTKKIVEDLKLELQQQAVRCMENPKRLRSHIKEMNDNPRTSPDLIFTELNQASKNLGKTMDDLAMIQSSAESLNLKTEENIDFLGVASLAEELNNLRLKPGVPEQGERFNSKNLPVNLPCEEVKMVVETNDTTFHKQSNTCLRTAEMRLVAARKMEEAARAAEALATSGKNQDGLCFPEPPRSPLTLKAQMNKDLSTELLRKLEEANEEVKQSKQALETALNQVEIASVKQLEAEEAFRQWNIESWKDQKAIRAKRSTKRDNFPRHAFLSHVNQQQHEPLNDLPKPVLKRNVSMRNVLNWKQVTSIDEKELVTPRRKFRFIHNQASVGETE